MDTWLVARGNKSVQACQPGSERTIDGSLHTFSVLLYTVQKLVTQEIHKACTESEDFFISVPLSTLNSISTPPFSFQDLRVVSDTLTITALLLLPAGYLTD